MPNEIIGVDTLKLKSTAKTQQPKQSQPMRIHQIAMQVNDLMNEIERITTINQQLIKEVKELRALNK